MVLVVGFVVEHFRFQRQMFLVAVFGVEIVLVLEFRVVV
jgi:hypothetical protein